MRGLSVMRVKVLTRPGGLQGLDLTRLNVLWVIVMLGLSHLRTAFGQDQSAGSKYSKNITVCRSTSYGLGHSVSAADRYATYRAKYTNCTYLDGNLELVFLEQQLDYDFSFLKDIREITGYVFIVAVYASYIPLTNLRIVRGQQLFSHHGAQYSIYIALNYNRNIPHVGLRQLGFVSLREVLQGNVFFHDNPELCHEDTIEWRDILPPGSTVVYNNTYPKTRVCEPCSESCRYKDNLYCWGPGPNNCQNMTKLICSPQCDGRCMGEEVKDCCAEHCAVGCTGTTKADCLACKKFENDGLCELECPPPEIYVKEEYAMKPNPDFKYSYGSLCVKSCPSHLIASKDSCEIQCDAGYVNVNSKCEKCIGPCPKTCNGSGDSGVNADNINSFRGCTIIQGNIRILVAAFKGDAYQGIASITVDQLSAFESVQEVSEFIQIQAEHPDFRNLSFLRNLVTIHGRKFISGTLTSLQIFGTSLTSLDLVSLTTIGSGNIVVMNNTNLCHASGMNWSHFIGASLTAKVHILNNRNANECVSAGAVCASECSSEGCWGPRDDQCFHRCANFRLENRCIPSCDSVPLIYRFSDTECRRCHPECKSKCTDESSSSCDTCLNVKDGPYCMSSCPETKYPDHDNICQSCHPNCEGGCSGSRNAVGPGACHSCALGRYLGENSSNVEECYTPGSECEVGFYRKRNLGKEYGMMKGKQGCIRCDSECLECDNSGSSVFCTRCRHFRQDERCVQKCSSDYFLLANATSGDDLCVKCHSRCLDCTGPSSSDCLTCKEYIVYIDQLHHDQGFVCMGECPEDVPDKVTEVTDSGLTVTVCINDEAGRKRKRAIILGCVLGGIVVVAVFIACIVIFAQKRAKTRKSNQKIESQIYGGQVLEPVTPSGVKPDLSKIRIIKESEMKRGGILGSGAFGTVYKGLWLPENEDCKMIVAIKVLLEGTSSNQNEELISEARIMASVENEFCIRILAFCMASQMMIVTELMPLGCLLDFVRNNKKYIGSKLLLNWCSQIAEGMAYLEEIKIVHRDLAARNVLLQSPDHVKITDFGLSKLLDHNENVVTYTGGKMPIKWLALESIQHKLFTHKSDVWSYGVTLWELFTYGQRPYENVDARNIPDLLEKGERLPQPSMCTIDVYMILIKCWTIEAASRPAFKHLAQEFEKMSHDSSRYLYIENDGRVALPRFIYDEKAVLRSLSVNDPDGPERLVSPDDYIKPVNSTQSRNNSSASDRVTDEGIRRTKKLRNKDGARSSPWKEQPNGDRRQNSRYCSDPCKAALQGLPSYNRTRNQNPLYYGNDSAARWSPDDYLEPSQSGMAGKYLDLPNESESESQEDDAIDELALSGAPLVAPLSSCVSNPEYFDMPSTQQESQSKRYNDPGSERTRPLLTVKT